MNYKFIILVLFLCTLSTFVFSAKKKPVNKRGIKTSTKPLFVFVTGQLTCQDRALMGVNIRLHNVVDKKNITLDNDRTRNFGIFYLRSNVNNSPNYELKLRFTYRCFRGSRRKTACINMKNFKFPNRIVQDKGKEIDHIYFLNKVDLYDDFLYGKYNC